MTAMSFANRGSSSFATSASTAENTSLMPSLVMVAESSTVMSPIWESSGSLHSHREAPLSSRNAPRRFVERDRARDRGVERRHDPPLGDVKQAVAAAAHGLAHAGALGAHDDGHVLAEVHAVDGGRVGSRGGAPHAQPPLTEGVDGL